MQQTASLQIFSTTLNQPSGTLHSRQILHADTLQTIADALAYLQHYLYEVTEQQNSLKTNINNTLTVLTAQLQQLTQLVSNTQLSPLATASSLLPTPTTPILAASYSCTHPKLLSSLDFHGDQSTSQAFFNSYALYICLALEQFTCEEKKVLWALTFFKRGQTTKWSKNLFRQEVDTGIFSLLTWDNFNQQFWTQFFLVNVEADAINFLGGLYYHQGS